MQIVTKIGLFFSYLSTFNCIVINHYLNIFRQNINEIVDSRKGKISKLNKSFVKNVSILVHYHYIKIAVSMFLE
jgi:hypothetical protein